MEGDMSAPVAEAAPALEGAVAAPDVSMPTAATETSVASVEVMDAFNDAPLPYEGSLEWTDADQAAFEGAVVEAGPARPVVEADALEALFDAPAAPDTTYNPDTAEAVAVPLAVPETVTRSNGIARPENRVSSPPANNRRAAHNYFVRQAETGQTPLFESDLFRDMFTDPRALSEGFWLSDLDPEAGGETDPAVQQERQAAIKYVAAELGLAVEDVTVETDDGIMMDTCIRSYLPEELPEAPVRRGDTYVCEGRQLSESEAVRVLAARQWAEAAGEQTLKAGLSAQMLGAVAAMGSKIEYALAITYHAPGEEAVRVVAEPSEKLPQHNYEHYSVGSRDVFLTKISTPDASPLPPIRRTSDIMGYDVERYQYAGGSIGQKTYDALLHDPEAAHLDPARLV